MRKDKLESSIEHYFGMAISYFGGKTYKWVSPGNPGVPDRIAFFPGGLLYLVELKKQIGGRKGCAQNIQFNVLGGMGSFVYVLNSMDAIDLWLKKIALPDMRKSHGAK